MLCKVDCEIIKDLIPSYIRNRTSDISNKEIREHLKECSDCKEYLEEMRERMKRRNQFEFGEIKSYFPKSKLMSVLKGFFIAIVILSMIIPCMVDFLLNDKLTWSYIVLGGCTMGFSFLGILLYKKKNKVLTAIAVVSILVIPYLYIIEGAINKYLLETPEYWATQVGLPISLLWIGVLWISIATYKILKINKYFLVSIFLVFSFFGNVITNKIAQSYVDNRYDIINYISFGIIIVIFFICGVIKSSNDKAKRSKY